MRNRRILARLSVVVTALTAATLAAPLAAMASVSTDIGDKHTSDGLSVIQTLGLFVAIPIGVFLIIVLLVMRPGTGGSTRYRPTSGWKAEDASFGDSVEAPAVDTGVVAEPTTESDAGGGSRGSW